VDKPRTRIADSENFSLTLPRYTLYVHRYYLARGFKVEGFFEGINAGKLV